MGGGVPPPPPPPPQPDSIKTNVVNGKAHLAGLVIGVSSTSVVSTVRAGRRREDR
jgi:hypothetical protein